MFCNNLGNHIGFVLHLELVVGDGLIAGGIGMFKLVGCLDLTSATALASYCTLNLSLSLSEAPPTSMETTTTITVSAATAATSTVTTSAI